MIKKIVAFFSFHISKIHAPFNHKELTESKCEEIIEIIQDGDVILSHTNGELSCLFLDYWGHAGIISMGMVYEATTDGVKKTHPMFFCSRKDDIKIMRPKFSFMKDFLNCELESELGFKYDFEFEAGDRQFYCFELAACALRSCSKADIQEVKTLLGKQYLAKSFENDMFTQIWPVRP